MTTDKARKRAVRSRMDKTGERYAAARRHVVAETATATPRPLPPRVADPGVSDEALRKGTGRDWDDWLRDLDGWGAAARKHPEIARHVAEAYGVSGWWAQSITVGYERARGMRAVHETSRGFEVSVSRTIHATPDVVWPWLAEESRRDRWIESGMVRLAASRAGRWVRFSVVDDRSSVRIVLDSKGLDRSVVTVTHGRLADADDVAKQRAAWRPRLDALRQGVREMGDR